MKLADAILLGSTLSKQGFGEEVDAAGNRCAFGAAHHALGVNQRVGVATERLWPWLDSMGVIPCPECSHMETVSFVIATHLNDKHRWTRERIAAWVATVEPQEEIPTVPVGEYCDVHQEAVSGR